MVSDPSVQAALAAASLSSSSSDSVLERACAVRAVTTAVVAAISYTELTSVTQQLIRSTSLHLWGHGDSSRLAVTQLSVTQGPLDGSL